jgi:hypothetical protein
MNGSLFLNGRRAWLACCAALRPVANLAASSVGSGGAHVS